jgi:hypothetical protein
LLFSSNNNAGRRDLVDFVILQITQFDRWFAAPGSVLMTGKVDTPLVHLTHAGFPDQESMEGHCQAWPMVLEQLESGYITPP